MKLTRSFFTGFLALALSATVTAGSLYITVSTAASSADAPDQADVPAAPTEIDASSPVNFETLSDDWNDETVSSVPLTLDGGITMRFATINPASGELIPAGNVDVALRSPGGSQFSALTNSDGMCAFTGLVPGLYTVTAEGAQGRLSYGIRAVTTALEEYAAEPSEHQPVSVVREDDEIILHSALSPVRDADALDRVIQGAQVESYEEESAAIDSTSADGDFMGQGNSAYESYLGHQPIQLSDDGSLSGQVVLLDQATGRKRSVTDLTVSFITDNLVVATARISPDGTFTQHNLLPGVYTFAVAGSDGIGYLGVDVVSALAQEEQPGQPFPASVNRQVTFNFGLLRGAGAQGSSPQPQGQDGSEDPATPPATPGGAPAGGAPNAGLGGGGGFTGGGGGGPLGGDGFGGLLGLVGAGLGAAALADDDDGAASPGN